MKLEAASRVIYVNGEFVPESEARLSIYDAAIDTSGVDAYLAYLESLVVHLDAHTDIYCLNGATALYVHSR